MKQSNQAITFLMAQYRAVLKNASMAIAINASVAAATLVLSAASPSANAAITNWSDIPYEPMPGQQTDLWGNGDELQIVGSEGHNVNNSGFRICIRGGSHFIKGDGDHKSFLSPLIANAEIELNNEQAELRIGQADTYQVADITINKVAVYKGKLVIAGAGNESSIVNGENIYVGMLYNTAPDDGKVELATRGQLGGEDTKLILIDKGTVSSVGLLSKIKAGTVIVQQRGQILLDAPNADLDIEGILIVSGGHLILGASNPSWVDVFGPATFSGTDALSIANEKSSFRVNGGDLTINKGALKENKGTIALDNLGNGQVRKLIIDQSDWSKLIEGKIAGASENSSESTATIDVKGTSASSPLDLSNVFLADGMFNEEKILPNSAKIGFKAEYATFKGGDELGDFRSSFEFDHFTVGKGSAFSISNGTFKIAKTLTAQDTSGNKADLSISNKASIDLNAQNKTGTISAKSITVDARDASTKALTFQKGTWNIDSDLIIKNGKVSAEDFGTLYHKGRLVIQNNGSAGSAQIFCTEDYIISRSIPNAGITVSGTGALADFRYTTLRYDNEPATYNYTISLENGGVLETLGGNINGLLADPTQKGTIFNVKSGAKLSIIKELVLQDGSVLKKSASSNDNVALVIEDGGIFEVKKDFEIQKVNATNGIQLNDSANIRAPSLKLTLDDTNASAILNGGNYTLANALQTNASKGLILSGGNFEFGAGSASFTIPENIAISGASVSFKSNQVNTLEKLTLTGAGASLNIGEAGASDTNITTNNLLIENGKLKIEKSGTLETKKLSSATNGVELFGSMTVNTTHDASKQDAYEKYGLKLEDDAVSLQAGSNLTLSGTGFETALGAVGTNGGKITGFNIDTDAFSSAGALRSEAGSTLNIGYFKKGTVISKDAFNSLVSGLFGNASSLKGSINLGGAVIESTVVPGGEVNWSFAKVNYGIDKLPQLQSHDLMTSLLVVDSPDNLLYGHWGAVKDASKGADGLITFADNASLNDARDVNGQKYFAIGNNDALVGLAVDNQGTLTLANGGMAGDVSLINASRLIIDSKAGNTTELKSISGSDMNNVLVNSGKAVINEDVTTGYIVSQKDTDLHIKGNLTLRNSNQDGKKASTFNGKLTVDNNVTLAGLTTFASETNVLGDLKADKDVIVASNTTVGGSAKLKGDKTLVIDGSTLQSNHIELGSANALLVIGNQVKSGTGDQATYTYTHGSVQANSANLNSGSLVLFGEDKNNLSIGAINTFGTPTTKTTRSLRSSTFVNSAPFNAQANDAGTINGNIVVGSYAALMVGEGASVEQMERVHQRTGAALYLKNSLTADVGSRIILDTVAKQDDIINDLNKTGSGKYAAAWQGSTNKIDADMYIGAGSPLYLGEGVLKGDAAIEFKSNDAAILGEEGAKIILDGDRFLASREIKLFKDADPNDPNVKILGKEGVNDIEVTTANGLMGFTLSAGSNATGGSLQMDKEKLNEAYKGTSTPVHDYLMSYVTLTKNWKEFFGQGEKSTSNYASSNVEREYLIGKEASQSEATVDEYGNLVVKPGFDEDKFVVITQSDGTKKVFHKAYNSFLEKVIRDTNGTAVEAIARMGAFGGACEVALMVGDSTYDAVSRRFAISQHDKMLNTSANGQGGTLWTAPIYKSRQSSDMASQSISYGTDSSIAGLALGGDYSYNENMYFGTVLNAGKGDSSGESAANGVSGDFNYYSVGLYALYKYQNYSFLADLGYSLIKNELKATTDMGKLKSSFDTTNLSAGITAQVSFNLSGIDIAPHLGARLMHIDFDDDSYVNIGSVSYDSVDVFSIPAGVSISKEFKSDKFSFKPTLDLNITGHFGDDSVDSHVTFEGIANSVLSSKTEFIGSSVSYGVRAGFEAQYERMSATAGVGYEGSSNVDELTISGNLSYAF